MLRTSRILSANKIFPYPDPALPGENPPSNSATLFQDQSAPVPAPRPHFLFILSISEMAL